MTLQQPASPQRCEIPPSCTIVPAEVDDLESICRFDGPMLRDYRQRDFVASAIEEGRCWVAFFDETPVAYGIFNYQFQGYGVIHRVYVSPPYRRRGIGRADLSLSRTGGVARRRRRAQARRAQAGARNDT